MSNKKENNTNKTEIKKPSVKKPVEKNGGEEKGIKKLFSQKNLAVVITAISLVVILAVGGIIAMVRYIVRDEGFDFEKSDLSKYMEFTGAYKDFTVNLDYAAMKDIDLKVAKLNLQASYKGEKNMGDASYLVSNYTITPGAELNLWYRGYLIDPETGEEVEVPGMSNFMQATSGLYDQYTNSYRPLEIGSSTLIPGFELNLVGKKVDDYAKFEKITTGRVEDYENHVIYVTFTTQVDGKDVVQKGVRIDMSSKENVDKNFGEGFYEKISDMKIGAENPKLTVKKGGNEFDYTKVKVNFVTTCENNPEKPPIIVEAFFPYDYGTANLRNEKAYFEVYVDNAVIYEYDEFDDKFVQKLIDDEESIITAELLNKYEGATLVEKYDAYANETIKAVYDEEYQSLLENAIWSHLRSITNIKKYPLAKVEDIYKEYLADVEYQFNFTGGSLQDAYGQSKTYQDLESFACAYLGLPANYDWRSYLDGMAKSMVQERMILFYVMELEGIEISDEEFQAKYDETVQEYLDEYVSQHLAKIAKKTKDDFTAEEYEQYVLERKYELFEQYDETFFTERTYYTTLFEIIKKWPTVITLDSENNSAYFDKYKK